MLRFSRRQSVLSGTTAALLALAVFCLVLLSGCRTTDGENQGDYDYIPWNTPAPWQGTIMGVPY